MIKEALKVFAKALALPRKPNFIRVSVTEARKELHVQTWIGNEPGSWVLMDGEETDELIRILTMQRGALLFDRRD